MAYKGDTSIIDCDKGGLTGATNIDTIAPHMMLPPSCNLLLEKRGRRKRGGTSLLYGTPISAEHRALGLCDALFENGNQYLLYANSNGDVYKNDQDKVTSGMGKNLPYSFAMGENKIFIADGETIPKVWNETTCANIAAPAADWSTRPPYQFMRHTRGLSQRMCALNGNTLYFSKTYAVDGDMEQFVTDAESLYLDTGDGHGMTGMVEIGEEIVLFSRHKAYRVDDSDPSPSNWGLIPAQWEGGVANWRLIVKLPNDVVCMAADGEIYSIRAVEDYGDYKQASLTRESWMQDYINEHVNLSQINLFHAKYFPRIRAIVFFVCSKGSSVCNTALIFYIDRPLSDAWMVHNNGNAASGYDASVAEVVESATDGAIDLFTGDYSGHIWKLNRAGRNDNGAGYYAGFRTSNDAMGGPRHKKLFARGRISGEPFGDFKLSVTIWIDGQYAAARMVTQVGGGSLLDDFILDDDCLAAEDLIVSQFLIGEAGYRAQYEIGNAAVNEDFFISTIFTDYKVLGALQD